MLPVPESATTGALVETDRSDSACCLLVADANAKAIIPNRVADVMKVRPGGRAAENASASARALSCDSERSLSPAGAVGARCNGGFRVWDRDF
jgi:hypothetical protein